MCIRDRVWENILRDDYDNWDVPTLQEEYNAYKQDNPLPVSYTHLMVIKFVLHKLIQLIFLMFFLVNRKLKKLLITQLKTMVTLTLS